MKKSVLFALCFLVLSCVVKAQNPTKVFEIESILVDACNFTSPEPNNEMVVFKVGPSPINITNLTISGQNSGVGPFVPSVWTTTTVAWNGLIQNAATATVTAALQATISNGCGKLVEPPGGIIPAYASVLMVTSSTPSTTDNSFASLTDSLYIIYHNATYTVTTGHFKNSPCVGTALSATPCTYTANPVRGFILKDNASGMSDTIHYDITLLTNTLTATPYGGSTAQNDGATVEFAWPGFPVTKYINQGCKAPFIELSATAAPTSTTICNNASASITGTAGGTYTATVWSGGTGTFGNPNSLNTTYTPGAGETGSIVLTLTVYGKCAGATATSTVAVNINASPVPSVTSSNGATLCSGGSTTLSVSATGTLSTTYSWSPGSATTSTVSVNPGVGANIYTVSATNSCGSQNATFTVNVNALPNVSVTSASVCPGFSATLNASGASTYTWNTTATGSSISDSPATTTQYTATGTDLNNCVNTATGTILVYNSPTVTVNSPAICNGGTVTLNAAGASTFTWSTTQTGNSITDNPSSNTSYTVVGTDANGCNNFAVSSVTVNPLPTITVPSATICPGNPATLTASGASTYTWSTTSNSSSITVSPAVNTTYTVDGTDANGCQNTATASVTIVGSLTVSAVPTLSVICNGSSTTLTGSGASSYTWSSASSLSSSTGTSVTASPTVSTTYTVVGSSGACKDSSVVTVNVNNLPTVTGASTQSVVCVGTNITLTGSGASTYTWTGGANDGVSFTPVATQTYVVSGTDINGCVNSSSVVVTVNPLPTVTVASATICPGNTATLTAVGASTYTWSTTSTTPSITVSPASTTPYTVTATDINNCQNAATATVSVVNSLTVTASPTSTVICNGSSTTITGNGATTYTWSSASTLSSSNGTTVTASPTVATTYTVVGSSGSCKDSSVVTINVNSLPTVSGASTASVVCAGSIVTLTGSGASTYTWTGGVTDGVSFTPASTQTYTVTGTDVNGCTNSASVAVTVITLTVNATSSSPAICLGQQTATLTASGATNYTWSPAVSLSSPTGTSVTASPTVLTTYTVIGTDAAGNCSATNTITINVNTPPTITAGTSTTSVCQGGSVTLTGSGGGIFYNWTGGVLNGVPFNPASTQTYSVIAVDANGCFGFATVAVTVNPLPNVTVNSGTICVGQQTATLTAGGANFYVWNPASTLSSSTGTTVIASPAATTNYTVTGTDGNGCVGQSTTTVTVNPLPNVTVNSPSICVGQQTATLTAGGATTYIWNTSATTNSITVNPTLTTSYTVIGTDLNNCVNIQTGTVTVNPLPTITATPASVCVGSSAILSAAGAATYTWSNGQHSASITVPGTAGSYTVTGTDVNGCVSSIPAIGTVTSFSLPTAAFTPNIYTGQVPASVVFTNASTGTILVNHWNFGNGDTSLQVSPSETYSTSGTYSVVLTVIDNHGCWDTASSIIVVTDVPLVIVIPNVFSPNGDNINDLFSISGTGIDKFNCKIYDRWGIFLYEWSDLKGGWDGKNASNGNNVTDGTYYFILSYSDNKSKAYSKQGYLQLVR